MLCLGWMCRGRSGRFEGELSCDSQFAAADPIQDFYRPIITPWELLLALQGPEGQWEPSKWTLDISSVLAGMLDPAFAHQKLIPHQLPSISNSQTEPMKTVLFQMDMNLTANPAKRKMTRSSPSSRALYAPAKSLAEPTISQRTEWTP